MCVAGSRPPKRTPPHQHAPPQKRRRVGGSHSPGSAPGGPQERVLAPGVQEILEDIPLLVEGSKRRVTAARKHVNGILRRVTFDQLSQQSTDPLRVRPSPVLD